MSQKMLGKRASQLTRGEAALIAGIIFIVAFTADLIGRGMAFALRERDRETAATEAAE